MRAIRKTLLATCAAGAIGAAMGGCRYTGDPAKVSGPRFRQLERIDGSLHAGMTKKEVLRFYREANKVKLTEAKVGNRHMEEWKVDAVKGPSTDRKLMTRYLYFADGGLVDCRDERWEYREDEELKERFGG